MNARGNWEIIKRVLRGAALVRAASTEAEATDSVQRRLERLVLVSLLGSVTVLGASIWPLRTLGELLSLPIASLVILAAGLAMLAASLSAFLSLFSVALQIQRAVDIKKREPS